MAPHRQTILITGASSGLGAEMARQFAARGHDLALCARRTEKLDALHKAGLRAEADLRNEKINYKVREHSLAKLPILLVVGKREAEERTVSVRRLGSQEQQVMKLDAAIKVLVDEAVPPDLREAAAAATTAWHESLVGTTHQLLVERPGDRGHIGNFAEVRLDAAATPGDILPITITRAGDTLHATRTLA